MWVTGERDSDRRAHTLTEVGQRAGPVQKASGLTSARMLRNHVAEFACLSPLTAFPVFCHWRLILKANHVFIDGFPTCFKT